MRKVLATLAPVLALCFAIPSHAQTTTPSTEPPSTTITVGQVTCPQFLSCYSVPLTIGGVSGTAWIYPQSNGGFILFRLPLEGSNYVTALVTSWTVTRNSMGQATKTTITYTVQGDPDNDGDTDTVMGSITLNIAWVLGGRWHNIAYPSITGGFGAQSITQH
jgi:hypothetical protein